MKKLVTCVALSSLILVGSAYAADPGSKEDPIVTKSYVDDKVAAELKAQETALASLKAELETMQQTMQQMGSTATPTPTHATYELVTIPAGYSIIGEQGTEMILRAGRALVRGTETGGVQDVTDGIDLADGALAPKYHLMIMPRTENRGIIAETEIIVMVRGGYTIQ